MHRQGNSAFIIRKLILSCKIELHYCVDSRKLKESIERECRLKVYLYYLSKYGDRTYNHLAIIHRGIDTLLDS